MNQVKDEQQIFINYPTKELFCKWVDETYLSQAITNMGDRAFNKTASTLPMRVPIKKDGDRLKKSKYLSDSELLVLIGKYKNGDEEAANLIIKNFELHLH